MTAGACRALFLVAAAGAASAIALAAALGPDPRGYGTHERLGLPPCGLRAALGLPCPACGLTTAFAHAARGDVGASFRAQPFGLVLFAACAAAAIVGLAAGASGPARAAVLRRFDGLLAPRRARRIGLVVIGLFGASWAYALVAATLTRGPSTF